MHMPLLGDLTLTPAQTQVTAAEQMIAKSKEELEAMESASLTMQVSVA